MRSITDTQIHLPVTPAFMGGSNIDFNLFGGAMIPSPTVSVTIDLKHGPNINLSSVRFSIFDHVLPTP